MDLLFSLLDRLSRILPFNLHFLPFSPVSLPLQQYVPEQVSRPGDFPFPATPLASHPPGIIVIIIVVIIIIIVIVDVILVVIAAVIAFEVVVVVIVVVVVVVHFSIFSLRG